MTRERYAGIDAVVFDLDGTLVDSVPDIAAAVNAALTTAGLTTLSVADVAAMVGNGSEVLISRAVAASCGSDPDAAFADNIHDAFLAAYDAEPCRYSVLYPGALDLLDDLRAHGVPLGVCTNKPEQITGAVLDRLGISMLFGRVVGGSARHPLKPAPDMLQDVLHGLTAKAGTSVMVGDSAADAGTAKAAGTRLILLEHGYSRGADLNSFGADAVIPGFAELREALVGVTRGTG